jgi:aminoglycoside 6'-N-acetyltransferase
MRADDAYRFRAVTKADLPLLRRWRAMPHVVRWWGAPELEPEAEKISDKRIAMWIVEHCGRPFAFAQDYCPHDWDPHPFAHLPARSRGIDHYIGEADMLDRGHGSAFIRAHCDRLFAACAPAVGTDPHPDNVRARRACEKAGFKLVGGPTETPWGRAVLMERRRGAP